jgi:RNA polymerase sigma-70 factor (ECF subfamily)
MKGFRRLTQQEQRDRAVAFDFDEVYDDHVDQVARWAARLAGPWLDVEDLVQEVFIVVYRQLHAFRGDAKLTTWLYRITEKLVLDRRRTERRRRWLRGLVGLGDDRNDGVTPGDELEQHQATQLVYRLLEGLPDNYRSLIILFELDGHSGEEVAELTGLKLATVWVRLHRAREQLRRRVAALPVEERELVLWSPRRRTS